MTSEFKKEMIAHWHAFKNPLINDILINLEKLEGKNPKLTQEGEDAIKKLVESCKTIKADQVDEMKFIRVLNQLPAAYLLYIVHKMQSLNPDLVMKIINYAQSHKAKDKEVGKFFQKNMVFEKSQLLGRIFSTSRMEAVLRVIA